MADDAPPQTPMLHPSQGHPEQSYSTFPSNTLGSMPGSSTLGFDPLLMIEDDQGQPDLQESEQFIGPTLDEYMPATLAPPAAVDGRGTPPAPLPSSNVANGQGGGGGSGGYRHADAAPASSFPQHTTAFGPTAFPNHSSVSWAPTPTPAPPASSGANRGPGQREMQPPPPALPMRSLQPTPSAACSSGGGGSTPQSEALGVMQTHMTISQDELAKMIGSPGSSMHGSPSLGPGVFSPSCSGAGLGSTSNANEFSPSDILMQLASGGTPTASSDRFGGERFGGGGAGGGGFFGGERFGGAGAGGMVAMAAANSLRFQSGGSDTPSAMFGAGACAGGGLLPASPPPPNLSASAQDPYHRASRGGFGADAHNGSPKPSRAADADGRADGGRWPMRTHDHEWTAPSAAFTGAGSQTTSYGQPACLSQLPGFVPPGGALPSSPTPGATAGASADVPTQPSAGAAAPQAVPVGAPPAAAQPSQPPGVSVVASVEDGKAAQQPPAQQPPARAQAPVAMEGGVVVQVSSAMLGDPSGKQNGSNKRSRIEKPWLPDEDRLLDQAIAKLGNKWKAIAEEYFNGTRTQHMCRNRFYRRGKEGSGINKCGLCGEPTKGHTCRMKAGNALQIPVQQRAASWALVQHGPPGVGSPTPLARPMVPQQMAAVPLGIGPPPHAASAFSTTAATAVPVAVTVVADGYAPVGPPVAEAMFGQPATPGLGLLPPGPYLPVHPASVNRFP